MNELIDNAKQVYVDVIGVDSIFYARVSKSEAKRLLHDSQGELEASQIGYDVYIGRSDVFVMESDNDNS